MGAPSTAPVLAEINRMSKRNISEWVKDIFVGKAHSLTDETLFRRVSLIAVVAWVGLGADALSSSCYGPEEAFKALGSLHGALAPFIALATIVTIGIICASYSQIIELFPGGGGGYVVASKLLSPGVGVVSGCALMADYVLTIALSIASGAAAVFSLLPFEWQAWKLPFAAAGTCVLTLLNLRGVKESVVLWVPVFFIFLATHTFAIIFALGTHLGSIPEIAAQSARDVAGTQSQLGWMGLLLLLGRAYSVGAGTYTGIETVSNSLSALREPRVATGKRVMLYMALSLGLTVGGLMVCYLLYGVEPESGKTLNAVLFERMTAGWSAAYARTFIWIALVSAAALLLIGAQAGFVGGPRVLSNMALDLWCPSRFASLSDRLVAQNGVLLMGGAAVVVLAISGGSVGFLVVLYSINVFITFSLSQLGMVWHWWKCRATEPKWLRRIMVNGIGLLLTVFILVMLSVLKFSAGGWATLLVTGALVVLAYMIRRHYRGVVRSLARLDVLAEQFDKEPTHKVVPANKLPDKTAVVLVNGFNGLGVHTLVTIGRMFPGVFGNYVFISAGLVDAGNFKGSAEIDRLREHTAREAERYAVRMRQLGFQAQVVTDIGTDVIDTVGDLAAQVVKRYPNAVFFGGQLVFPQDTWMVRLLHNYAVFAMQRKLFRQGTPFLILPIRV